MRMIYVDEAGISAKEPRCVVAAVLIEPDRQYRIVEAALSDIFDRHVPAPLRHGYHFHATEVFSGGKIIDRKAWNFDDRLDFIKEVLAVPFIYDVSIAFAIQDKSWKIPIPRGVTRDAAYHMVAFGECMARADHFLRKYALGREKGVVVCEDIPQHRSYLVKAGFAFRDRPLVVDSSNLRRDLLHQAMNVDPAPVEYRIDHIIDVPHFVNKKVAPIIQLADACAFAVRRWVNKEAHGSDLALAMFGPARGHAFVDDPIWYEGSHSQLIYNAIQD